MSNITKINYIRICGEIYHVTDISFFHMAITVEPMKPDILPPDDEIFDITDFPEFRITINNRNSNEPPKIILLSDWKRRFPVAATKGRRNSSGSKY